MSRAEEKLRFLLALQEECGGSIPFERYMREALYHPDFGYYTASIRGIGRKGDFTTWPVLHRSLATAIARWIKTRRPRHVIEVGAGTGELAAAVRRALGWWGRPQHHIVEISPVLRAEQQKLLGRGVTWHPSMRAAVEACGGEAVIYSNELVDAFPCRVFQKQGPAWRELALRIEGTQVSEQWLDTTRPESTAFAHDWPDGQRIEVQESFRHWVQEWLPAWQRGAMLSIDYGDVCPDLYQRRPRGTLRSYVHHTRKEGEGVYMGFGQRDITLDVNFSDLRQLPGLTFERQLRLDAFIKEYGQVKDVPATFEQAGEAFQAIVHTRRSAARAKP